MPVAAGLVAGVVLISGVKGGAREDGAGFAFEFDGYGAYGFVGRESEVDSAGDGVEVRVEGVWAVELDPY